jgi:ankyrin repeat protein
MTDRPRENKYEKKEQNKSLVFLQKPSYTTQENVLKADLLYFAILKKNRDFVKEILRSAGSSDYVDYRLYTPYVHDTASDVIIERKHVTDKFPEGYPRTALTLASFLGLSDVVRLLVEKGANVNEASNYTPLEYAMCYRLELEEDKAAPISEYKKIVNTLIYAGARVNPALVDIDNLLPSIKKRDARKTSRPSLFLTINENSDEGEENLSPEPQERRGANGQLTLFQNSLLADNNEYNHGNRRLGKKQI